MCAFQRKKAYTNDWGTCLCSYCLNPELKVEALNGLNLLPPVSLEDDISEDKLSDFFGKLDSLMKSESETVVTYQEWKKVENETSDKVSKISRKVLCVKHMSDFLKMLKKGLVGLKEHPERIYSKYNG